MQPHTLPASRANRSAPRHALLWLTGGLWLSYSLLLLAWLDIVSTRSLLLCLVN